MALPLLVHLFFHPASASARGVAQALYRALNDDPSLPGLCIPTVIAKEDETGLPPVDLDLSQAERNFVVMLVEDNMVLNQEDLPEGRADWPKFVGDTFQSLLGTPHRMLPIQLSESAHDVEARLDSTNFPRAFAAADPVAFTIRSVVTGLCLYLLGMDHKERLPLSIFVSHSKQDLETEPKVVQAIMAHLNATQPVHAWYDSAEIEGGSQFAERIEEGLKHAALLVVATRSYSSRPWCRMELLMAKQRGRPIVVIDALEGLDLRSFPYGGNVPELRWGEGGAERAVNLMLKEMLRSLHVRRVLGAQAQPNDQVLTAAPELATIASLPPASNVLYPDPPLGEEEIAVLSPLRHQLLTPLQRAGVQRMLSGVPIAVSTSETDDSSRFGVFSEQQDAALLDITRFLLIKGATLHYGGHLGDESYTTALFDMVQAHRAESGLPPVERVVNDVGWPLPLATVPAKTRAAYQRVARYRRVPRPDGIEELEPQTFVLEPVFFPADSMVRRFAWSRGMSVMRQDQTKLTRARVVLGGKVGPKVKHLADGTTELKWYMGRIPGVVEEAVASLQAQQPLYLVGGFGGAAALVGDLLCKHARADFTWEFHSRAPYTSEVRDLYLAKELEWLDYADITKQLGEMGLAELSAHNGLSVEENQQLLRTRDVSLILALLLKGLERALT